MGWWPSRRSRRSAPARRGRQRPLPPDVVYPSFSCSVPPCVDEIPYLGAVRYGRLFLDWRGVVIAPLQPATVIVTHVLVAHYPQYKVRHRRPVSGLSVDVDRLIPGLPQVCTVMLKRTEELVYLVEFGG